ncbi:hypothetical protein EEB11_08300 [Pseudotabrizicola sediminis]|uniref:Uncharacterized protein n=2 Tax=Pseudotabrizicola sediminis TaxID=2486418 RepID=A0ABY2KR09_9RHOB|nr:hypothetical protein EEB11_08300 [Pseudotabrizicola sediminis]
MPVLVMAAQLLHHVDFSVSFISRLAAGLDDAPDCPVQIERLCRRALQFVQCFGANASASQMATEFSASLLDAIDVCVLSVGNGPRLKRASSAVEEIDSENGLFRPFACRAPVFKAGISEAIYP